MKEGYIYCVVAYDMPNVKVGYSTTPLQTLLSRYSTYYGNRHEIYCLLVNDCAELETRFKRVFDSYNVSHEPYKNSGIDLYKLFFVKSCEKILTVNDLTYISHNKKIISPIKEVNIIKKIESFEKLCVQRIR